MRFQVEARPKLPGKRPFLARHEVEAESEKDPIEEAVRRFRRNNQAKDAGDYTFTVVRAWSAPRRAR